ncbi:MAG: DNA polymerase III subunit epsilon [Rhodospirillaceae bacterium]|nr:DNA polymerase III subunit epsilon [Rhodospirillaceae bacterium]
MREIVLDTETTGLDPASGNRIVEIGCLELENHVPSGATYHQYINPERDMPDEAFRIHGLSEAFLEDYPTFAQAADEFCAFIGDAPLVIHNAAFDMGFINAELVRLGRPAMHISRAIDTVQLARKKFPGAPVSLDALCRRFGVDNQARTQHGALLDAGLLASVYLELVGGRQQDLALRADKAVLPLGVEKIDRPFLAARKHEPTSEERIAHAALVDGLNEPVWRR